MKWKANNNVESLEDEHSKDRYLITYADLITLLLGLFVILYASGQVDETKYKEFTKAFSKVFKVQKSGILNGSDGILDGTKGILKGSNNILDSKNEPLDKIASRIESTLSLDIQSGNIDFKNVGTELIVSLPEKLLFESGKANIKKSSAKVLDTLASVLSGINKVITIDGHTDNQPISSFQFASNWHLSVERALNISYYMIGKGLPENHLIVRGFGEHNPIFKNNEEWGRSKNRRVELTISDLPVSSASTVGYKKK